LTIVCCGTIIYYDGKILLGLRSWSRASFPGVWDLPGRRQEQRESIEQTLVREIQEELGITPLFQQYLWTLDISSLPDNLECHIFLVTEWDGVPSNLAPLEHDLIQWFVIEDACSLKLACPEYTDIFRSIAEGTH
jgi:8-oxo-dGTP diphosphatase